MGSGRPGSSSELRPTGCRPYRLLDGTACPARDVARIYAKVLALFTVTAPAEILGCFPSFSGAQKRLALASGSRGASLMDCVRLLTLHAAASGRVHAAYGCVSAVSGPGWLLLVEKSPLPARIWRAGRWLFRAGSFFCGHRGANVP